MPTAATVAVLALTLLPVACSGPPVEEFTREDATTVRQVSADLAAAFNAKEVDKIVDLYAENSVFMPPNAPLLRGRDPLKGFFGNLVAKASDLTIEPTDVVGHGPLAYASGTYRLVNAGVPDRGKFLVVLRKTVGKWRFEHTIWSSDLPQRGPAQ